MLCADKWPCKNHGKEKGCNLQAKTFKQCDVKGAVEGAVVVLGVAVCRSSFWVLLVAIWMPPVQQATKPTRTKRESRSDH